MNQPPNQPAKKGLSTLSIVLIVIGVLFVLGLGTCVGGAFILKSKAEQLVDGGGLVLVSPPEVKAELAGVKRDYIGSWRSAKGSTLDIDADGNIKMTIAEGGTSETVTAVIAAFHGDDIQLKMLITLTIPVTVPPHRVGDHFQITAKSVTFER